ncbi:MAG: CBS domain-containing protein [Methanobrevibacter sp.]|jgi:predicted transcriptional regulator|nr:CBS domain-containing protein [Candidatus Methanovirga basalitermitum]
MKVKDVMNKGIISVKKDENPNRTFEKMYEAYIKRLFVVDDNDNLVGVISHNELINLLKSSHNGESTVESVMSKNLFTIYEDDSIKDCANLMLRAAVSGLLVVKGEESVGVITRTDICRLADTNLLVPKKIAIQ